MSKQEDRRRSARMSVSSLVSCRMTQGERSYHGRLRDMSVRGLYLDLQEKGGSDGPCEVEIMLKGENSRLTIEGLTGSVIRCDEQGAAIRLDNRLEWFPLISSFLGCRL